MTTNTTNTAANACTSKDCEHVHLYDYRTGEELRPATSAELEASIAAARTDGGHGVIEVDGRSCYVR